MRFAYVPQITRWVCFDGFYRWGALGHRQAGLRLPRWGRQAYPVAAGKPTPLRQASLPRWGRPHDELRAGKLVGGTPRVDPLGLFRRFFAGRAVGDTHKLLLVGGTRDRRALCSLKGCDSSAQGRAPAAAALGREAHDHQSPDGPQRGPFGSETKPAETPRTPTSRSLWVAPSAGAQGPGQGPMGLFRPFDRLPSVWGLGIEDRASGYCRRGGAVGDWWGGLRWKTRLGSGIFSASRGSMRLERIAICRKADRTYC